MCAQNVIHSLQEHRNSLTVADELRNSKISTDYKMNDEESRKALLFIYINIKAYETSANFAFSTPNSITNIKKHKLTYANKMKGIKNYSIEVYMLYKTLRVEFNK